MRVEQQFPALVALIPVHLRRDRPAAVLPSQLGDAGNAGKTIIDAGVDVRGLPSRMSCAEPPA